MKALNQSQLINRIAALIKGQNAPHSINALLVNLSGIFETCTNTLLRISVSSSLNELALRFTNDLIAKGDFTLSPELLETLVQIVEEGPVWDGDIIAPSLRNDLLKAGLVVRVPVKGEEGFSAASHAGKLLYLKLFAADTIPEAIAKRKASV